MELSEILQSYESKTLEFKQNTLSKDRLIAAIIAFANTSGGKVIIGIEDKTKNVVGVFNPHQEEERLATLISDSISPRLLPVIEILPWRDTHVIIIDVPLSSSRPHFVASKGREVSTYVRVGSTNRLADAPMIESIKRSVSARSYDEETAGFANIEDIDMSAIQDAFQPLRIITKKDLLSLEILSKQGNKEYPTVGGLLFFGKDKQRYFYDAWIQAGCFQGLDKTTILDSQDLRGHFHEAVHQAMLFIRRHISVGLHIEAIAHEERWAIPKIALREAILNALIHTDYELQGAPIRIMIFDDRIEIENPGLVPYGLTIEDIKAGVSKLRNRVIARVFRELKQTEQWGSGIKRMIDACKTMGLEEPKFEEIVNRFRVTFYKRPAMQPPLDPMDVKILGLFEETKYLSTKSIADSIGLTTRSVRPRLVRLMEKGKVQEIARSHKDPHKRYVLVDK